MSAGARVAAFVALLAVIFGGAALAGGALDPGDGDGAGAGHAPAGDGGVVSADHADDGDQSAEAATGDAGEHGAAGDAGEHGAAGDAGEHGAAGADDGARAGADAAPAGVWSSQDGYRLVAERTRFAADRPATLRFRILGAGGETVRDFETEQERRMHVIVVRRDLRRYQHLHPVQEADGAWATKLTLPQAGVYRAFADFRAAGAQHTLGVDLFTGGDFEPIDLPAPATSAAVDGYAVSLHEHDDQLGFYVRRGGRIVTDLQPYLGARGHLVALREGDLAYSHVHPLAKPPPEIAFATSDSAPGTYRLFLQFRHRGRVRTAAFTRTVGG